MDSFEGKYFLVTGATSGIGRELVNILLQDSNAYVYAVGRNETKLNDCFWEYRDRCKCVVCDLLNLSEINHIFSVLDGNRFDGMVHCAGLSPLMKVVENDIDTMIDTYKVNFFSFIELCKYFHNPQYTNDGASIIAMSSIAASAATFRQTIYSSSKAALEHSILCIAKEFLDRKIRVNAIAAGAVETEMLKELEKNSAGLRERMISYYPLGLISTKEIINIILYLLSSSSKHIDGSVLKIDSAYSIH